MRIGEAGTPFEIRIKPDFPVSPKSLQVAESILLERLALSFSDGVDSKALILSGLKIRRLSSFLKTMDEGIFRL